MLLLVPPTAAAGIHLVAAAACDADGIIFGLMFLEGVPGYKKWPVAPASAIPKSLLILIVLAALLAVSTGV